MYECKASTEAILHARRHTFLSFTDEMDPFWLWGDWLLSDVAKGEEGLEVWGSGGTKGRIPSSKEMICLGAERLCEGIIVRLLGFLHPY